MARERLPAVYILASGKNGTLYIGVTSDLWSRVSLHKQGHYPGFTKRYGVTTLVWYENFPDMPSAIAREKQMKKWNRAWKVRQIEQTNALWEDLALDWYS